MTTDGNWGIIKMMSPNAQRLLEDALRLPDTDRADLAALLIDSLDRQTDEDAQSAWDSEIACRLAEIDAGSVEPVPWPEARRRILGASDGSTNS